MGKRIELETIYRPKKSAVVNRRQPKVSASKPVTARSIKTDDEAPAAKADITGQSSDPSDILAHKRAMKAAQMRRYRAKKKAAK